MQTIEVPPQDWRRTLDEFSAIHEGCLVSLDLLGPSIGAQHQMRNLPLQGVTADIDWSGATIAISAARRDGEHITHLIHAPTHVRIERTSDGADVAIDIESADGQALLLLETVVPAVRQPAARS